MAENTEVHPQSAGPASLSRRGVLASAAALAVGGCASGPASHQPASRPPALPVLDSQRTVLGRTLRDPYGWVDDAALDDPRITAFLRAHQEHAAETTGPQQVLSLDLMRRAAGRAGASGLEQPVRHGAWRYRIGATPSGRWALFRRPLDADDEALVLAAEPAASVTMWGASADGRRVAYAVRSGPEEGLIRVRDVDRDEDLPDRVARARVNIDLTEIVWARDGSGFFYSEVNPAGRPWRAMFHRLGAPQTADLVLFEEADPAFFVVVRRTTSGAFATVISESTAASEVRLVPLAAPGSTPLLLRRRQPGHTYAVDEAGGALLIRTNDVHPNGRLVTASVAQPEQWREVLPADNASGLTWHLALDRHWVVSERAGGLDRIRVIDRRTGDLRLIEFPDAVYTAGFDRWSAGPEVNSRSDAPELVIGYESFVRPRALYRYRLDGGVLQPPGRESTQAVRASDYVLERLFAPSADGAAVPISLLRRADRSPGEHGGLVLYGYGAYGNAVQATFDPARLGLLDNGVMFALAHVRGGNDQGGRWAAAGRGTQRDRPILDFIACARHLVRSGYVKSGAIVAEGHSAGAWLAASAANLTPGLFAATLLHVPYVDVLTDLLSSASPTAESERAETGDPRTDPDALELLLRIDPYRTLPARGAQATHITGVLTDARVSWRGIVKFAASAATAGAAPLVLRLADAGSHWAPADPETARRWPHDRYAFAISCLAAWQ